LIRSWASWRRGLAALEHVRATYCIAAEGEIRKRLAQLVLDAGKIMCPSGLLSAGGNTPLRVIDLCHI